MRKTISTIAATLFCVLTFAQTNPVEIKPFATIQLAAPKKLSENFNQFMRAAAPDTPPQQQMIIAMALAQFGYPFFDGIDGRTNVVCGVFEMPNGHPQLVVVGFKADTKKALVCKNFAMMGTMSSTSNGWWFTNMSTPVSKDVFDAAVRALAPTCASHSDFDIAITYYPSRLKLPINDIANGVPSDNQKQVQQLVAAFGDILNQAETLKIAANIGANKLDVFHTVSAFPNSNMANLFNFLPRRQKVAQLGAIDANADVVCYASFDTKRAAEPMFNLINPVLDSSIKFSKEQSDEIVKMMKKCGDTFASSLNFLNSSEPKAISIMSTTADAAQLEKYYATINGISANVADQNGKSMLIKTEFKNTKIKISGFDAFELLTEVQPSASFKPKSYWCVKDGYIFQCFSKESLADCVKKFEGGATSSLPSLSSLGCDAFLRVNMPKFLAANELGDAVKGVSPLDITIKFKRNSFEGSASISTKDIAVIYKAISLQQEKAAASAIKAPSGNPLPASGRLN